MKNATNTQNSTALVLLPPAKERMGSHPVRRKKISAISSVRKSLREQAAGLRNVAVTMYVLAGLIVVLFCSCNSIAKDIYVAAKYLAFNIIDEQTGNIVSLICCLIGILLGGFTALVGIYLDSSAEALKSESRKLNKEV